MTCCGSLKPVAADALPDGIPNGFVQADSGLLLIPSTWALPATAGEADRGSILTVIGANDAGWLPLYQRKMILAFGSRAVTATAIWQLPFAFDSTANTQVGNNGALIPMFRGRIRNMRIRHNSPVVSGDTLTYTLVLNGTTDTALTVAIDTNTPAGSNVADIVEVTALDQLNVKTTGATATRTVRSSVQLTLEY